MEMAMKTSPEHRDDSADGRILRYALLPLFVLAEGAHLVVAGLKHDHEAAPRTWFAEAQSQASVATSYVLMARSMLQSSERRHRPECLS